MRGLYQLVLSIGEEKVGYKRVPIIELAYVKAR